MPQDACHAKSSINLLQLNNGIVLANIANSKRHDADDSDIVKAFTLDRFTVPGNERLPLQPAEILHPASNGRLLFFSGKSQKKCHSSRYVKRNFRKQIMDINSSQNQEPQPSSSLSAPVEFNYHQ
ncbi:hypothetical protein [Klebsiella pneumoniae]